MQYRCRMRYVQGKEKEREKGRKYLKEIQKIFGGEVMTDENRTFLLFPDDGDDLTEWDEASDLTIQNEQLEEILSEERALELERELEQDENQLIVFFKDFLKRKIKDKET